MEDKEYFFISGLPRSGSTLLSSLLQQNSDMYIEGNSGVCQLMWDLKASSENNCGEQIKSNNKENAINELISLIPNVYYNKVDKPIVFDKCRSWTLSSNYSLIENYITKKPKIIVLIRPIIEIIKSFEFLHKKNNIDLDISNFLIDWSEPVVRSYYGILDVIENHKENCMFITYDTLVSNTKYVMDEIYSFLEITHFNHDFNNININLNENSEIYGLNNLHYVSNTISKSKYDILLPDDIIEKYNNLDNILFDNLNKIKLF